MQTRRQNLRLRSAAQTKKLHHRRWPPKGRAGAEEEASARSTDPKPACSLQRVLTWEKRHVAGCQSLHCYCQLLLHFLNANPDSLFASLLLGHCRTNIGSVSCFKPVVHLSRSRCFWWVTKLLNFLLSKVAYWSHLWLLCLVTCTAVCMLWPC